MGQSPISSGNLVFDGEYWYQYDAWNRLISVREAGALDPNDFLADGRLAMVYEDYDAPGDPNFTGIEPDPNEWQAIQFSLDPNNAPGDEGERLRL